MFTNYELHAVLNDQTVQKKLLTEFSYITCCFKIPLLLGRPFLETRAALIDVYRGELTLRVGNEVVHFNLNRSLEHPDVDVESCMAVENNNFLSVELNSDCILQQSINEIEMNFQYLKSLDCEILPSNLFNRETISSINENN